MSAGQCERGVEGEKKKDRGEGRRNERRREKNTETGGEEDRGGRGENETMTEKLCKSNTGKRGECGGVREESGRGSAGVGRVAWRSIAVARQRVELSGKH